MSILTPGINGFTEQPQQDPRVGEAKLSEGERLLLAQQRSRSINLFSNVEEANRYHQENISHLLVEEKYEAFLPVMLSSTVHGQVNWAPSSGVHTSGGMYTFANNSPHLYSHLLDVIEEQLTEGFRLSNIKRSLVDSETVPVFNYIPRMMVEYNTKFVQLCVVVVITQGDKYLLLRTPDADKARIRNKLTFVQGHVEIEEDINDMSAIDYLTREAEREINEEVVGLSDYLSKMEYCGLFHDSSEPVSQEHISAVFRLYIPEDVELKIETNEADKHSARFYTLEEIAEENAADNIVQFIIG